MGADVFAVFIFKTFFVVTWRITRLSLCVLRRCDGREAYFGVSEARPYLYIGFNVCIVDIESFSARHTTNYLPLNVYVLLVRGA